MKKIFAGERAYEEEIIDEKSRFNERVMLGLRAKWGIDLDAVRKDFGDDIHKQLLENAQKHIASKHVEIQNNIMRLTQEGKFLSDGIASDLFWV